ncbi:hypothetical protein A0J57_02245 [Sphingobium sp. 22B]|nr:hypothetical protein AXW74_13760 [Sphingobium sp. AM]KYC34238.1 hypothetical protein A0J57_02245 [Sphingobium sp. 22B]OAP33848.1 hypothetical protein A8O16_01460 [Sphingobium sp. 20006FA]TKV42609.1 hypothetical protein A0U87_17125 [Sphingobium sp. MP9-4]
MAGRRRSDDWHAFLDRPQARLRQMLFGAARAEPGIVRRIEQKGGTPRLIDDGGREDNLVADRYAGAQVADRQRMWTRPRHEGSFAGNQAAYT